MIKCIEKKLLHKLDQKVSAWWYGLSKDERNAAIMAHTMIANNATKDALISRLEERNNDLKAEVLQLKKKLDPNYNPVKKL